MVPFFLERLLVCERLCRTAVARQAVHAWGVQGLQRFQISVAPLEDGSLNGSSLQHFRDRVLDCLGPRAQFMVLSGQEEAPFLKMVEVRARLQPAGTGTGGGPSATHGQRESSKSKAAET